VKLHCQTLPYESFLLVDTHGDASRHGRKEREGMRSAGGCPYVHRQSLVESAATPPSRIRMIRERVSPFKEEMRTSSSLSVLFETPGIAEAHWSRTSRQDPYAQRFQCCLDPHAQRLSPLSGPSRLETWRTMRRLDPMPERKLPVRSHAQSPLLVQKLGRRKVVLSPAIKPVDKPTMPHLNDSGCLQRPLPFSPLVRGNILPRPKEKIFELLVQKLGRRKVVLSPAIKPVDKPTMPHLNDVPFSGWDTK